MSPVMTDDTSQCLPVEEAAISLPDWPQAKTLYVQGFDQPTICAKCNVSLAALRKRVLREGWAKQRQERTQTVSLQVPSPITAKAVDAGSSEKVRSILGELAVRYAQALQALAFPRSLRQIREHIAVLASISDASAPLFGWNTSGAMTLNFIGMSSARVLSDKDNLKAIDCPSVQIPQQIDTAQRPTEPVVAPIPEQKEHALSGPAGAETTGQPL